MARSNITMKSSISLQGISKIYKGKRVIDQLNLELQEGEFLSLLGPSGSGKTTILRMVAGLVTPDEGKVVLKGEDISNIPPNKRNMGMVFQQYALFPHMTVQENVAYGLKARKLKKTLIKEQVQKYLKLVGLEHLASRKPRELSGGQQQRVSLARALTVEPVVLLFDEPLSNLDARLKEQMLKEIRDLHRSLGFTAIYVTHDQSEALYLSDKIVVLNEGNIEQFSTPEEILKHPASAFVADFFGFTNRLSPAMLLNKHMARVGELTIPLGHLGGECKEGDQGELLFRDNAFQIMDFNQEVTEPLDEKLIDVEVVDCRYIGGATEFQLRLLSGLGQEITTVFPRMIAPLPSIKALLRGKFYPDAVCFFKGDGSK